MKYYPILLLIISNSLLFNCHHKSTLTKEKAIAISGELMGKKLVSVYSTQELSASTKSYVSINQPKLALINAHLIDGTGRPPKTEQSILIENGKIIRVGDSKTIKIPMGFHILDVTNKTIIPGIIGTHNHLRLPQGAMFATAPKLYLACGVTTIQTCGTGHPREEIAIARSIQAGDQPGPEIVNSGPYFTGPSGKSNFIRVQDEQMIRDTIRYWAERGVEWFKVYRNTRPQDLAIIIDEAHKRQAKVTGHLCATTFEEAANLGIDAIEHGFIHSYDHAEGKLVDSCSGSRDFRTDLAIDSEAIRNVQQALIDNKVALTSTLAIFECQARGVADERDIAAMAPFHKEQYQHRQKRRKELGEDWYFKEKWLLKSMQYDVAFFRNGGLLTAGPDPGLHNLPGYGDQRNYQLFIEAGFRPEEAIQVMTSNGAKLLERPLIGSIEKGKLANLVVLDGNLSIDPTVIQKVDIVFKNGMGYDPTKLIESINGNVGSSTDDRMTYCGQKEPGNTPSLFAPNFISKPDQHEFGSVFSKSGRELFYGVDVEGKAMIYHSKLVDAVWSKPSLLLPNEKNGYNDPMLSPDEQRLYFISNRPINEGEEKEDYDIWYVERQGESWSAPINAGDKINSNKNEYYISFTTNGTMYFGSNVKGDNFDIYQSEQINGQFQTPIALDKNINTNRYEADVFIAPDASYMIFCARRSDSFGRGDLYISFKDAKGNWMPSKNMGNVINSEKHELCPFVIGDGKYFFYTSDGDIYWVSTAVFEDMK